MMKKIAVPILMTLVATTVAIGPSNPARAATPNPYCSERQSDVFNIPCLLTKFAYSTYALPLRPLLDKYWWPTGPIGAECTDRNGRPSHERQMYSTQIPDSDAPFIDPPSIHTVECVEVIDTASVPDLTDQAKRAIPLPVITSDFTDKLLVGADVSFWVNDSTVEKDLVAPGYRAWIEARISTYEWDFGDGETSSDAKPIHVYETKPGNSENSDSHSATISVKVVWDATLHINQVNADGREQVVKNDPLPPMTLQTSIQRQIIEVWSAQTEPN